MRFLFASAALAVCANNAAACPNEVPTEVSTSDAPAPASPCFAKVEWSSVRRVFEARYAIGAGGTSRSGVGSVGSGFAALELAYGLQFGGEPAQPSYEIEVSGGVAVQQFGGAFDATGLVTTAGLKLGPARMAPSVVDEGRGNLAVFPLTMEIAHVGELAARPRISDRPEVSRALYDRERIELATRIIRVEGAGEKASNVPPGQTASKKPSSWAIDVFPLHAGVDLARQDATRFGLSVGGALLGAVDHTRHAKLDLLGVEYRRVDLSPMGTVDYSTVWMLRLDGTDPKTGTTYTMGWGEVLLPEEFRTLSYHLDSKNGTPTIGGFGWYSNRSWGGFGMQYKREAYISMTGELGIEDRVFGEVYIPRALDLVARTFGARTQRVAGDEIVDDYTTGIELSASYARDGWSTKVGLELGRTFYTALDNGMPVEPGYVAAFGVTMQHAGSRAWTR